MKRSRPFYVAALAAMAFIPATVEAESTPERARPVLSVVAEATPVSARGFTGTVVPRQSVSLGFRILGRMTSRKANVGDVVSTGRVLATLDPTQLQQSRDIAAAQLVSAEAQLTTAAASEQRMATLLKQDNTSQAVYDAAKQALDTARSSVESAKAGLDKANEQLGYAQLTAEFPGVITAVGAEPGQTVSAGQMVITLAGASEREVAIDVPSELAGQYPVGTAFDIVLQALPSVTGQGTVREVTPFADAHTRTIRLRLEIKDPPIGFRLGSTVTATAHDGAETIVRLPASALLERDGQTAVWIVDEAEQRVRLRTVSVSERAKTWFAPGPEVKAGERVVIAGVKSLVENQKVLLPGASQ